MEESVITFNKPYFFGLEMVNIQEAILSRKLGGDGVFTKKCHQFFEEKYGFNKVMLTTSCTDALEMCAILIDTQSGDEIIMPSYTYVSTANAFVLRGAKIVFADSEYNTPNIDCSKLESLITPKTKAIVCMHYAGISCDMDELVRLCNKYNIYLIEDAALAIDSYFKERPLGSIGHLAAFSFHETKNVISGEGGMLVINERKFIERAEIIREKGTNRSKFIRGEIDKYGWVDIGSSYLPSDVIAAILFAQLAHIEEIQTKRIEIWNLYFRLLEPLQVSGFIKLPQLPEYATNNGQIFYIICRSIEERTALIEDLWAQNISSVFHYRSLHTSSFFNSKHDGRDLPNTKLFTECLLRLPSYFELTTEEVIRVCKIILKHYSKIA